MQFRAVIFVFFAFLGIATQSKANGLSFSILGRYKPGAEEGVTSHYGPTVVLLEGTVETGDSERFVSFIEQSFDWDRGSRGPDLIVILDSPGGSLLEALDIANSFRFFSSVKTYVDDGKVCLSACALIWSGGWTNHEPGAWNRWMHPNGTLGFHSPYVVPPYGNYSADQIQDAALIGIEVSALLIEKSFRDGIPLDLVIKMLRTPPDQFFFIDSVESILRYQGVIDPRLKIEPFRDDADQLAINICYNAYYENLHNPIREYQQVAFYILREGGANDAITGNSGICSRGSCVRAVEFSLPYPNAGPLTCEISWDSARSQGSVTYDWFDGTFFVGPLHTYPPSFPLSGIAFSSK